LSTRRNKRKRKLRLIYASVAAGVFVLACVIIGIIAVVGLPRIELANDGSSAVDTSRLEGLSDLVIPEYEEENLWWITNNKGAEPESPSEILQKLTTSKYSRMMISGDVLFAPDKIILNEESTKAIGEVVKTVQDPQAKVIVVCHSSSDGPEIRRLPLSEERAAVLAGALELAMGRDQNSIDRVGLGDSSPLQGIDGTTVAGRTLNRRCEVFVELIK
jgi:outer membrane protein OmpA-like peptidoglycan-associated protein